MSIINSFFAPFKRLQYAGVNNPRYVSDVVAANELVLDMVQNICGLGATDFAIFAGLVFTPGTPNTFTPGIFFLNGAWYYMPTTFNEGLYLAPNIQPIMPVAFTDTVTRNIYQVNYGQSTGTISGSSPVFSGNMNAYRLDLKSMGINISALQLATKLQNVQISALPASYIVTFTNDQAVFFASATVDSTITFDFTNAVPGTNIYFKWTFGAGLTLTIVAPGGSIAYLQSGDLSRVASAVNILSFLYAGKNESGDDEVSYTLSQV